MQPTGMVKCMDEKKVLKGERPAGVERNRVAVTSNGDGEK